MNKSAIEIFEELGYECDISCEGILYSKFITKENKDILLKIDFDNCSKKIKKVASPEIFKPDVPSSITLQELQAINQQVEELGWLDE